MLKRSLIFLIFLLLCVVTAARGSSLHLFSFVFYPLLTLPALYFFLEEKGRKIFFILSLAATTILLGYFLVCFPSAELVFLGFLQALLFFVFLFYVSIWQSQFSSTSNKTQAALHDLDLLKQKHHSRLESLHHLEKQVAGLLDLFEIARDFSEHLNYEGMAEILYKKVLPELQFKSMELLIFKKETENELAAQFEISAAGVKATQAPASPELAVTLNAIKTETRMLKVRESWLFPLMAEGKLAACLMVSGANEDDLAKFEVLSAFMALHVKKVDLYETVKELAIRDGLTGVFVRRHFVERFEEELRRCEKYQLPLAVLMLDIDHFKRYNDEYGHLAGDATLKQVAAVLRESLRQVDIVARYGGEEFVMVLPETRKEGALEVAERIRSNVARHNFKIYSQETRVTVSIGVSLYPNSKTPLVGKSISETVDTLVHAADKALYRAKEEGRNRIILNQEA